MFIRTFFDSLHYPLALKFIAGMVQLIYLDHWIAHKEKYGRLVGSFVISEYCTHREMSDVLQQYIFLLITCSLF